MRSLTEAEKDSLLGPSPERLNCATHVLDHSSDCSNNEKCLRQSAVHYRRWLANINGQSLELLFPRCRGLYNASHHTLACAIGEDLGFSIIAVNHSSRRALEEFAEEHKCRPFSQSELLRAGILPVVDAGQSTYWRQDELLGFAAGRRKRDH